MLDEERCDDEASLRELFRDTSEQLSGWGLALGGSEDWADRLYIEDKKGNILFSEEELDLAEEAQKRMELMYNVDAWSTQLVVRVGSGQLLLTSGVEGTREDVLTRVLKRIEEDMKYHAELFADPTSALILSRIEDMGLPNTLRALDSQIPTRARRSSRDEHPTPLAWGSSNSAEGHPRCRGREVIGLIERMRNLLPCDRRCRRAPALGQLLDQLLAILDVLRSPPHLPQEDLDDDDCCTNARVCRSASASSRRGARRTRS